MASNPPSTASQNWLIRASTKFEKSVFRKVEHKYKAMIKNYVTTIDNQNSLIEMLKSNHEMLEDQLYKKKNSRVL